MPDELQGKIYREAFANEGRYLLPRLRSGNPQWDACERLVDGGYARWLPHYSTYSPGIVLTGKPLETDN